MAEFQPDVFIRRRTNYTSAMLAADPAGRNDPRDDCALPVNPRPIPGEDEGGTFMRPRVRAPADRDQGRASRLWPRGPRLDDRRAQGQDALRSTRRSSLETPGPLFLWEGDRHILRACARSAIGVRDSARDRVRDGHRRGALGRAVPAG